MGSFVPMARGCSWPGVASGPVCSGLNSGVGQVFQFAGRRPGLGIFVQLHRCFWGVVF